MMSSQKGRKRSREEDDEDDSADCPFSILLLPPPPPSSRASTSEPELDSHSGKKRRPDGLDEEKDKEKRVLTQLSPFAPGGKFPTKDTMDLHYAVQPRKRWLDLMRYNSFVLNGTKYYSDMYIYVANESTLKRQKSGEPQNVAKPNDYWVARILEIRAADEHHVYARVYWMYSPEEIPANSTDRRATVSGRQPYHGANELIASNHMDVINVVSVVMPATVNHWIETDDEVQESLYWRQALDCRTSELSAVQLICKCKTPANPDKTIIGCTKQSCHLWMHYECLKDDLLTKIFDQWGYDKPYTTGKALDEELDVKKEEDDMRIMKGRNGTESSDIPMSPRDSKNQQPEPTIDVRRTESMELDGVKPDSEEDKKDLVDEEGQREKTTDSPVPRTNIPSKSLGRKGRLSKGGKRSRRKSTPKKLYEGLFDATLDTKTTPAMWEVTDLRTHVQGGIKTWLEVAHCLACGSTIE